MRASLLIIAILLPASLAAEDAREIVRRSVSHADTNWLIVRDYTWQERNEEREIDSDGGIRSTESKTYDVVMIGGSPYRRLIARGDQPLPERDEVRERHKFDEAVEKGRRDESRRAAEREKERARERELLQEIAKAYNFTLIGEEEVHGRDAWKILAEPAPDYHPPNNRAKLLSKMRGTLWIEKGTFHWCRARIEIIEPVSFGLFLFRLNKGTTAALDLKQVNGEIWLPERLQFHGSAKVALVKTVRADAEITYNNYRKFQSSSEVIPDLATAGER